MFSWRSSQSWSWRADTYASKLGSSAFSSREETISHHRGGWHRMNFSTEGQFIFIYGNLWHWAICWYSRSRDSAWGDSSNQRKALQLSLIFLLFSTASCMSKVTPLTPALGQWLWSEAMGSADHSLSGMATYLCAISGHLQLSQAKHCSLGSWNRLQW